MRRTLLGRTGIEVSGLCYGTMSFGGDADEAESARLYAACRDAGIDFFDCADVYSAGRAEEILGRLMAHERDRVVVTSKFGHRNAAGPEGRGGSRRNIRRSVEASLRRLGTDRLDVYFIHMWDEDTALEETVRALDDLVTAGKVLALGASNFAAWQVATALGLSRAEMRARFEVLQPMYSLVKRQAEVELLPLAVHEGLGVIPYSPVGGGLLSGKYRTPGATGRVVEKPDYARRYAPGPMHETAAAFAGFAEARGIHPVSLAVAWVAAHPAVTAPIIGARNTDQLRPALESVRVAMTPELRAEVAALSPTPAPATDRTEEQAGAA